MSYHLATKYIHIAAHQLEYVVFNEEAAKYLLCFHGFGQSGHDFKKLAKAYPSYKIVGVNLFFHQNSYLRPVIPLKAGQLKSFFDTLIETEFPDKFSIVGYSMGGRFALTVLKLLPQKINSIYLLAPDGLVDGEWYRFATKTSLQRRVFKNSLNSYPTFLWFAKSLSKAGFLNKGLLKFTEIHLKNKEERVRVFNTWTNFRFLKLPPQEFQAIINKHKIKALVVLGMFDRVIPIRRIAPHLTESTYLEVRKVPVTHNKLFYYNFLDPKQNLEANSNELS